MSVVLDALRKLDREKSSRKRGTANIAVDILRPDLPHPGGRIRVYIVVVAVAAVVAAAITYGVIFEFGFLPKPLPPATKPVPAPRQQVSLASPESTAPSNVSLPAPAKSSIASQPVASSSSESKLSPQVPANPPAASKQIPAPVAHAPVQGAQGRVDRVPAKIQTPAEKKEPHGVKIPAENKSPATPVVDKKTSQDIITKGVDIPPKKITEPTPNTTAANPASLKLSAIVWFEDPSRRFAMINGIMATEGSSVEGMKVVEINPTSVRLLHDGQYFEISMSK